MPPTRWKLLGSRAMFAFGFHFAVALSGYARRARGGARGDGEDKEVPAAQPAANTCPQHGQELTEYLPSSGNKHLSPLAPRTKAVSYTSPTAAPNSPSNHASPQTRRSGNANKTRSPPTPAAPDQPISSLFILT
ncbi:uncharacterized protein BKA78DRAFT_300794 [Phyllosticta capitalensis]|uniref:uncharacterized protein n=1 Tax=Phyllosticta capitalensis TaxID=121624 RepID=UPI003131934F